MNNYEIQQTFTQWSSYDAGMRSAWLVQRCVGAAGIKKSLIVDYRAEELPKPGTKALL